MLAFRVASIGLTLGLALPATAQMAPESPHLDLHPPSVQDGSFWAGAADFSLHLGEAIVVTGGVSIAGVVVIAGAFGSVDPGVTAAFLGVGLGFAALGLLGMPALDALVLRGIGNGPAVHHRLGPLLETAYATHLVTDLLSVAIIALTGNGAAALLTFLLAAAGGATIMGYVHHLSAVVDTPPPTAAPSPAWSAVPSVATSPIPMGAAPATILRF